MGMRALRLALALAICPMPLTASEEAPSVGDLLSHVWHDQRAIVTSPLRMDAADRWVWGATAVSMIVLMPNYFDRRSIGERYATGIEREHAQYSIFFKRLTWVGDGGVMYGLSAASYGFGAWSNRSQLQKISAHWLEALIDTGLWVTGLKILVGRNRPGEGNPHSRSTGPRGYFKEQGANSSFPSGHSALAFASAAVMTREAHGSLWVGIPAYALAGGVAFSRVYVEKHWLSDVLFGAALGHSIGMLVENRRHKPSQVSWRLEPMLIDDGAGLRWTRRW